MRYINSEIITNWWCYYLVKWGIKRSATIYINTKPDFIKLSFKKEILRYHKGLIKILFRLVSENRLEYYLNSNEMVVYDERRKVSKRSQFDFVAIGTIERLLGLGLSFELFDADLLIVDIFKGIKLFVRKRIAGDVNTITEVIIRDEYKTLKPYLKDAIVLDIGAYIGDSSVKFVMEGAKKVFGYEPHPESFKIACRNVELNNLGSRIILKNSGVSNKREKKVINEDCREGASGCFGLANYRSFTGAVIDLLPLDSIILTIGDVDVMKMDCEGAEFPAILSCPVEILRRIKVMVIEYHSDPESLIVYLKKAGFLVHKIKEIIMKDRIFGLLFAKIK